MASTGEENLEENKRAKGIHSHKCLDGEEDDDDAHGDDVDELEELASYGIHSHKCLDGEEDDGDAHGDDVNELEDELVLQNDIDLLNPLADLQKRKHKLKWLAQSPNSFFMMARAGIDRMELLSMVVMFQLLLISITMVLAVVHVMRLVFERRH